MALVLACPGAIAVVPRDEASLLLAFDANVALIHAAAVKAYGRDRKGSYELGAADF